MRAAALALALLVLPLPAAEARGVQPGKCVKPAKAAKAGAKGCRRLASAGTAAGASHTLVPMVGVNPFAAATPAPVKGDVPGGAPAPGTGSPPTTPPAPSRLGVTAREWSLVLSRNTLPAGEAVVELQNFGEDAHNLHIERSNGSGPPLNVPLAESGERQKATGALAPGDYKVYCALPGHDAQGMHARLTVN